MSAILHHRSLLIVIATVPLALVATTPTVFASDFVRGDCNGDGIFDISDPVLLLGMLFVMGSPTSTCDDACDANDDGVLALADAIFSLSAIFGSGPLPPAPFPDCGADASADSLGCDAYDGCATPVLHGPDIQPIWDSNCFPCHSGGNPAGGLGLVGDAYGNIVDVPSSQLPSMSRITPGDPQQSYIWHKLKDTQDSVGGSGGDMPPSGALSQELLDLIEEWILQGANP